MPSVSGEGDVFVQCWAPDDAPKAILQIAHGMCEHSDRYAEFAGYLAEHGYAVFAEDHLGHGRSANGHMGTFADKKGGFEFVMRDMFAVFEQAKEQYPSIPCILFGHSMGSILSGVYANRFGDTISALILMGTPSPNPAAGAGKLIASIRMAFCGYRSESKLLTSITAASCGEKGKTPFERKSWLSYNEDNVRAYVEDERCGVPFSASANYELFSGLQEFGSKTWSENIPDIPVLVTAGEDDPCGGNGEGPKHYHARLIETGHKAELKLFPHARHEILNETNKKEVYDYLLNWLDSAI